MRACFFVAAFFILLASLPVKIFLRADLNRAPSYAAEICVYGFCLRFGGLIRIKRNEEGKERRYLDQLCLFENKNQKLQSSLIFDNGQLVTGELSEDIKNKFLRAGIREPFLCREIEEELRWKNQRGSIKRPVVI